MLSQFPLSFLSDSKRDALFYCIAYDYSCAGWDDLHDHLKHFSWKDMF